MSDNLNKSFGEVIDQVVFTSGDVTRNVRIVNAMKQAYENRMGVGSSNALPADTFDIMFQAVDNYNIEAWNKINPLS